MWRIKEIKKFHHFPFSTLSTWGNVNYAGHHDMILVLLAMILLVGEKMQIHNQ